MVKISGNPNIAIWNLRFAELLDVVEANGSHPQFPEQRNVCLQASDRPEYKLQTMVAELDRLD